MEFEDMKLIWDSQNNEPLYAINQEALHMRIQEKGKSVTRLLNRFDLLMIGVNLVVGIILIADAFTENGATFEYVLPILYLAFFFYSIYRRYARRQDVGAYEPTILGDLEKAIWQVDYLIKQTRDMIWWYLLPLMVVAFGTILLNSNSFRGKVIGIVGIVVAIPVGYYGSRWEANKCYLPKKRELESLQEMLLQAEEQTVA